MASLDGRAVAKQLREASAAQAGQYRQQGIVPTLAIVVATKDEGAWWYVRALEKAATNRGLAARIIELAPNASTALVAETINQLAADSSVHGILLQTPLPEDADQAALFELIPPAKDVDGASPVSAGHLLYGIPAFAPATAEAVMVILDYYKVPLAGHTATVIGRSRIVGRPVANLLTTRDATVTICHSQTTDLAGFCKAADVLVVAVGKPALVTADMVKPEAIVIDVGTNVVGQTLVGDVDPAVADVVAGLTPVPGGVGPVTTELILQHTLTAVAAQTSK